MGSGRPQAKTQELWRERLERWRKSKLSDEEFAAVEGIKPSALKWWGWRLKAVVGPEAEAPRGRAAKKSPFVEVTGGPPTAAPMAGVACHYEVVLGNGRVVRVPQGFQGVELATLLAVAEGGA